MYLKRLLALLCSLALVFCLLPSTAFAEGGNGNIDGGGGSMGQGTSSNFWNPGNDGVRITVVDADSGNAISSPIDFTNRSQNNVVHFGKVNKLQYLAGTALTPQSGAGYDYTRPIQSMPTIVSSKGQSNIEAIKRYFCSEYACQMVAQAAGVDYERMIAGDYKLLIEPIAYFTHNGQYYCMTATEAALYDQKSGGALRKTMTSLTHKNLPLSMFLEFSDLGLPAWTGSTTSKQSNADIISSLGVGIVWFDERPPEGEIEAPDVEYRVDTDVITSVTLRTDTDLTPDNPASVTFHTVLKSYPFIGVMGYAAGENPLSYPEVKYAMVLQLVNAAARLVDFVILDCSSNMTNVFTPAAIESGDLVIRILTPDLKGVNYLKAHQPLLGDGRFHYDQHMTFAGMARPFHALDEMGHIIGGWDGLLPYGKEIDRCATEGGMFQAIKYCNPKYTASLNKVLDALEQMELADHAAEDDGNETEHFEEETADE